MNGRDAAGRRDQIQNIVDETLDKRLGKFLQFLSWLSGVGVVTVVVGGFASYFAVMYNVIESIVDKKIQTSLSNFDSRLQSQFDSALVRAKIVDDKLFDSNGKISLVQENIDNFGSMQSDIQFQIEENKASLKAEQDKIDSLSSQLKDYTLNYGGKISGLELRADQLETRLASVSSALDPATRENSPAAPSQESGRSVITDDSKFGAEANKKIELLSSNLSEVKFQVGNLIARFDEREKARNENSRAYDSVAGSLGLLQSRVTSSENTIGSILSEMERRGFNSIEFGSQTKWQQCPIRICGENSPYIIRQLIYFDREKHGARPLFFPTLSGRNALVFASGGYASYFLSEDYFSVLVRWDLDRQTPLTPDKAAELEWRLDYLIIPEEVFVRQLNRAVAPSNEN